MSSSILVIDDDISTLECLVDLCAEDVLLQSTGEVTQGAKMALDRPPALIVLCADLEDAFTGCRQIRKDETLRSVPVIMISASTAPDRFVEHAALPSRADSYVHKPLNLQQLASEFVRLDVAELLSVYPEPAAPIEAEDEKSGEPEHEEELESSVEESTALENEDTSESVEQPVNEDTSEEDEAETPVSNSVLDAGGSGEEPHEDYDKLKRQHESLQRQFTELRVEHSRVVERLQRVKVAQRRVEDAHDLERSRWTDRLEKADLAVATETRDHSEMMRLRALSLDWQESVGILRESLEVSLNILGRFVEAAEEGAAPESPSSDGIALSSGPPEGEASVAITMGSAPTNDTDS